MPRKAILRKKTVDENANIIAKSSQNQGFSEIFTENDKHPSDLSAGEIVWSVHELSQYLHHAIEGGLPALWLVGEVSNLTLAASGHAYFSLKDAQSQIRCAFFKPYQKNKIQLQNGQHIQAFGQATVYEARGELQFKILQTRDVGMGDAFARLQALKEKLQKQGLFDLERKKSLPKFPKRIGIITSLQAAALRDVLKTLSHRCPSLPVIIYPTPVQGAEAPAGISAAIASANAHAATDVLLLCRGGGAYEDLAAFNEEIVVRAIAASTLPIICGVGHESDSTLADFAADWRAATPTAAAHFAAPDFAEWREQLKQLKNRLFAAYSRFLAAKSQQIADFDRRLISPSQQLQHQQQRLKQATHRLHLAMQNHVQTQQQQLHALARQLQALSPLAVLARGFVCVFNEKGDIISDFSQVQTGERLILQGQKQRLIVQVAQVDAQNTL